MSTGLDWSKLSDRAQRIVGEFSGGYVRIEGATVAQFVDGDLKPLELPEDVADELVRAAPTDGSFWVRRPEQRTTIEKPPKPQRSDFPGDEVSFYRAAAQYHDSFGD